MYETLLPMRGLAAYGSALARQAADRSTEVLLTRRVLFRRTDALAVLAAAGRL